jgi:hypothetical protein
MIDCTLRPTTSNNHRPLNVYVSNELSQVIRCCELVQQLKCDVIDLSQQWPEVGALKDIVNECDRLLGISCRCPLMRAAAFVERLLGTWWYRVFY